MGNEVKYNELLSQFFYYGRHTGTQIIFSAQWWTLCGPGIRSNTDFLVLFNTDHRDSLDALWANFAAKMNKDMFAQMLQKYGEDHGFLLINNDPNISYRDKFFFGKAEELDCRDNSNIVGCKEGWRKNEKQLKEMEGGDFQLKRDKMRHLGKIKKQENVMKMDVGTSNMKHADRHYQRIQEENSDSDDDA